MDNVSVVMMHRAMRNISSYRQKAGRAGRENGACRPHGDGLVATIERIRVFCRPSTPHQRAHPRCRACGQWEHQHYARAGVHERVRLAGVKRGQLRRHVERSVGHPHGDCSLSSQRQEGPGREMAERGFQRPGTSLTPGQLSRPWKRCVNNLSG